jgi:hypothetical protein
MKIEKIKQSAERMIWVTFSKKGYHYFPAAAIDEQFSDVNYLGNKHRHLFKFKVAIEVYHQDREIEFHQFLNWLESLFDTSTIDINSKSVEMLSDDLFDKIAEKYPQRKVAIEISEDGECGCCINYTPSLKV